MNLPVQHRKPVPMKLLVLSPRYSVHTCRSLSLDSIEALQQKLRCNVVQKCREPQPPIPACCFAYTFKTHRRTTGPALRPECGSLVGVPLGYAPSLHRLRGITSFVRRFFR
jgi:hypothetical protein